MREDIRARLPPELAKAIDRVTSIRKEQEAAICQELNALAIVAQSGSWNTAPLHRKLASIDSHNAAMVVLTRALLAMYEEGGIEE